MSDPELHDVEARRGHPRRAPARPDGDAPLRRHGLARAGARRPPRHRLRRPRPRRREPAPGPSATTTPTWPTTSCGVLDERGPRPRRARGRLDGRAHAAALRARRTPSASPASSSITPAYDPDDGDRRPGALGRARATGCARAGWRASSPPTATPSVPAAWRETVLTVLRQRLGAHEHPEAVADALRAGAALAALRDAATTSRALARPDRRRRRPRRGRPGPPARGGRGVRRR